MLSVDTPVEALKTTPSNAVRIGMVLGGPLSENRRAQVEAQLLSEAGYAVFVLCLPESKASEARPDSATEERSERLTVHYAHPSEASFRIPLLNKTTRAPMEGWMHRTALQLWNIDTIWQALIRDFVKLYDLQILHVHDLPLANTAMSVANRFQIPLVVDFGVPYPVWAQTHESEFSAKDRQRWEDLENVASVGADEVIVPDEATKVRLMGRGVPEYKLMVLSTLPDFARFDAVPIDSEVIRCFKSSFLMTYVGPIRESYSGLKALLDAMRLLAEEIPELQLVCAGAMDALDTETFYHHVHHAGLGERVHLCQDFSSDTALVSCIEAADLCLYPIQRNEWTEQQLPAEILLYQFFKKPMVTSDFGVLATAVTAENTGLTVDSAETLAAVIRQLYQDGDVRRRMGNNGKKAIRKFVSAHEKQAESLLALYGELSLPLMQYGARQPLGSR